MDDSKDKFLNESNDNTASFEKQMNVFEEQPHMKTSVDYHKLDRLRESADFDESKLYNYLNDLSDEALSRLLNEIKYNFVLFKASGVFLNKLFLFLTI